MNMHQLLGDAVRDLFFSLQVLTNLRYFCRLSKKRKFFCGSPGLPGAAGPPVAGTGADTWAAPPGAAACR